MHAILPMLLILAWLMPTPSRAAWPNDRPIEIIVGFAPGGPSDVLARSLAPYIAKRLGPSVSIVILNRAGAGGEIAVGQLSRANAEGYTLGIVNLPGYFFLPMYRKTSYRPKDLVLVARVIKDPQIMVVRKDSPLVDLKSVVDAVKTAPMSLTVGNNGIGTSGHLGMASLEQVAEVSFNNIPFNGSAQQKTALAGGHLDIAMLAASEISDPDNEPVPIRIVAQFGRVSSPSLPGVPTTFEQGFPVELFSERGFAVPRGVSSEILTRLEQAIAATWSSRNLQVIWLPPSALIPSGRYGIQWSSGLMAF